MIVNVKWWTSFRINDGTAIFFDDAAPGKTDGSWMYSNNNASNDAKANI